MPITWKGFDDYFAVLWWKRGGYLNLAGMLVLMLSYVFRPALFLLIPILPGSFFCGFMMFRYRERWAKAKREQLPPGRHLVTKFFLHPTVATLLFLVMLVATTTVIYNALHH